MGQPVDLRRAKSLEERRDAATLTRKLLGLDLPIFLDEVTSSCGRPEHYNRCGGANFERLYAAWPVRCVIFDSDSVVLDAGEPSSGSFCFDDVRVALDKVLRLMR